MKKKGKHTLSEQVLWMFSLPFSFSIHFFSIFLRFAIAEYTLSSHYALNLINILDRINYSLAFIYFFNYFPFSFYALCPSIFLLMFSFQYFPVFVWFIYVWFRSRKQHTPPDCNGDGWNWVKRRRKLLNKLLLRNCVTVLLGDRKIHCHCQCYCFLITILSCTDYELIQNVNSCWIDFTFSVNKVSVKQTFKSEYYSLIRDAVLYTEKQGITGPGVEKSGALSLFLCGINRDNS